MLAKSIEVSRLESGLGFVLFLLGVLPGTTTFLFAYKTGVTGPIVVAIVFTALISSLSLILSLLAAVIATIRKVGVRISSGILLLFI